MLLTRKGRFSEFSTFIPGEGDGRKDGQQMEISEKINLSHNIWLWLQYASESGSIKKSDMHEFKYKSKDQLYLTKLFGLWSTCQEKKSKDFPYGRTSVNFKQEYFFEPGTPNILDLLQVSLLSSQDILHLKIYAEKRGRLVASPPIYLFEKSL